MTHDGQITLDSYRLAQYAVQVPCYICSGPNTFDAELCRNCSAPMALTYQAETQNVHPRILSCIGASGVGKTVFLGMLMDMLSRQPDDMQLLARGAFSITLQQTTVAALSRCEFPDKTPNEPERWNWVHCQVRQRRRRKPIELIMPDVAGEALIEEVDHPDSFPVIRSLLAKSAGVMILIDASTLSGGASEQDYFTMKLLSYLLELVDDPKNGWHKRPVALVFTKADESELCFENPLGFAEAHTPGVWRHCEERFQKHEYFAAGVAGACANIRHSDGKLGRAPLRVEPRGIVEPFRWLVEQVWS